MLRELLKGNYEMIPMYSSNGKHGGKLRHRQKEITHELGWHDTWDEVEAAAETILLELNEGA